MKKVYFFFLLSILSFVSNAQLLDMSPKFITETTTNNQIIYDANFGNKGLLNYTQNVYVHIGVITNKSTSSSDWKYVNSKWGVADDSYKATTLGNNTWQFTISSNLRSYFGITDATEHISRIAIIFRSADGNIKGVNTDGSDMYVPVYDNGLYVRIDKPYWEPKYDITYTQNATQSLNSSVDYQVYSSASANISLQKNNATVASANAATTLTSTVTFNSLGSQSVFATASNSTASVNSSVINYNVPSNSPVLEPPAGIKQGINYYNDDPTKVTLVLFAPEKSIIRVMGDFNNWNTDDPQYIMNKTADGRVFWITLNNLVSGQEYAYQYIIDESLKLADYNAEKVLDPWNDPYIDASTYPNLKSYPSNLDKNTNGIVSVFQTNKPVYNWQITNFQRPQKEGLRVYELLVRDFVQEHNWNAVKAKISYIKSLGMNAIELMPFNEFEGNISWGYNPNFYFAPDKYYGTETALKQFIDECHAQGLAVIMDMVLNHSFGSSPMIRMYWDAANNQPAANSPWFNQTATHPFNVGYDFNHESEDTKYFVSRVIRHWLDNYKIDGYRFDLSKGFTQHYSTDLSGWNQLDQSRINIWYRYYDSIQAISPNAYCVLEHLGNDDEEIQLSNKGMLLWENMNHQYNQLTMGWSDDSNLDRSLYTNRGWTKNNMLLYMESHDEERLMYKNIQFGNSNGMPYNVKDSTTGYARNAMAMAFWATTPGPKMIWQFGELGYPYSINTCEDGVTISDGCRTSPKPVHWDYLYNPDRVKLKDAYSKMMSLRNTYPNAFVNNYIAEGTYLGTGEGMIKKLVINSPEIKVVVVGNFDITSRSTTVTWPATGEWYPYLSSTGTLTSLSMNNNSLGVEKLQPNAYAFAGNSTFGGAVNNKTFAATNINVNSTTTTITLQPGEFYVYTNKDLASLPITFINFDITNNNGIINIAWSTAKEESINSFEIERSTDGTHFSVIGNVSAKNQVTNSYTFNDTNVNELNVSEIYYRIKAIGNDNKINYTEIKKVNVNTQSSAIIYPNPGTGKFTLKLSDTNPKTIIIYDILGKSVYETRSNTNIININIQNKANGMYILKIVENNKTETHKIIKQ